MWLSAKACLYQHIFKTVIKTALITCGFSFFIYKEYNGGSLQFYHLILIRYNLMSPPIIECTKEVEKKEGKPNNV